MYVCAGGDGVMLRSDAGCQTKTATGFPDGTALQASEASAGCSHVEVPGGAVGYVPSKYLCTAAPTPPPKVWYPTYDDLARNTEAWVGRTVHIEGEVIQVLESWREQQLRVNMTWVPSAGGYYKDTVFVHLLGAGRVLEGDRRRFDAVVNGRISYTTVLGARITLPELTVDLTR